MKQAFLGDYIGDVFLQGVNDDPLFLQCLKSFKKEG